MIRKDEPKQLRFVFNNYRNQAMPCTAAKQDDYEFTREFTKHMLQESVSKVFKCSGITRVFQVS